MVRTLDGHVPLEENWVWWLLLKRVMKRELDSGNVNCCP